MDTTTKRRGRPPRMQNNTQTATGSLGNIATAQATPAASDPGPGPDRTPMRTAAPEGLRQRRRQRGTMDDRFAIPQRLRDLMPHSTLEWKRESLYGKEDPHYLMAQEENGFEVVQASQLPGMMPENYKGPIRRDGMVLMERPVELTREAEAELRGLALGQIGAQQERLGQTPAGTFSRNEHPQTRPNLRTTHEAMPID